MKNNPLWAQFIAAVISGFILTMLAILGYKALIWAIHL